MKRRRVKPMDDVVCEYYLRFMARDKPGVLGAIASVLGRMRLSIASVIQKGSRGRGGNHGAGNHADPRGARAQPEARAGGDSRTEIVQVGTLPSSESRSSFSRWPSTHSGLERFEKSVRLSHWPGLIEHYRRFLPVTD